MKPKLVKEIDESTWRKFVAYCKLKDVKVGEELGKILEEYLDKHFRIR